MLKRRTFSLKLYTALAISSLSTVCLAQSIADEVEDAAYQLAQVMSNAQENRFLRLICQNKESSLSRATQCSYLYNGKNYYQLSRDEKAGFWKQYSTDQKLKTEKGIDEVRDKQIAMLREKERLRMKRVRIEECKYWAEKAKLKMTQGNSEMVRRYCFGEEESAVGRESDERSQFSQWD